MNHEFIAALGGECVCTRKIFRKKNKKIDHWFSVTSTENKYITLTSSIISASIVHTVMIYNLLNLNPIMESSLPCAFLYTCVK